MPALLSGLLLAGGPLGAEEGETPIDLARRIGHAVDRGRAYLEGHFPRVLSNPAASYPMGYLALPLAALLRAGLSPGHPLVQDALEELAGMPPRETYSVVCHLMALDAYVQAQVREARRAFAAGKAREPARPIAEGPVRSEMEEMVRWLVASRNPGQGTWHYLGKGGYDYSNTQFAVLGLQVALEHRIAVPREVFQEIARQFSLSVERENTEVEVTVALNPGKQVFLTRAVKVERKLRVPVGGWGYTAKQRPPYASMTAAGASSLLVARNGLGGSFPPAAEAALDSAYAWIAVHLDRFLGGGRHVFYTLYSLEKVGDLGDVYTLNGKDWYREGARAILGLQEKDGGWGGSIDTAFALLFLTRASRPAIRALPAPRVATRAAGDERPGQDRVYIDTIDGYVSAGEFFAYLEATRDRDLLKVAGEVVKNYPLQRQGELVAHLLALWSEAGDPIGAFARRALREVTGEEGRDPALYLEWHRSFEAIRALEREAEPDPDLVAAALAGAPGLKLRARALELIGRKMLVACVPVLIDELRERDPAHRERVADILERLTGERPGGARAQGERVDPEVWGSLWRALGEKLLAGARIRKLITLADDPTQPRDQAARAVDGLAAEGRAAVPHILEAMGRPDCSVRLITALERITSKALGLRASAWREWWEAEVKGAAADGK